MIKRILIVSDPFAAPGYLPRVRYLCDYLSRKGYVVTLLTEQYQPLDFAHDYPIVTIPMYSGSTCDWIIKTIWTLLTNWHDRVFAKRAVKALDQQQKFDVIVCSAFAEFPLGAAKILSHYYHAPLLCDIRDLDEQVDDSRYQYKHNSLAIKPLRNLYKRIHHSRRNKVLRSANAITTISPWHVEFIKKFNPNTHLVYNGYDPKQFYAEDILSKEFKITYIGSLFEWQKPGLDIVKQSIDQLDLPIILDIHTPQNQPIAYTELGNTIRQSSIMLVLTDNRAHGMMTTKFYEALGCDKPILCVPSDNGELAKLIADTHAGIATENIEQIKSFITNKYNEWKQNGYTTQHTLNREQFSRETQCEQIEQIILSIAYD